MPRLARLALATALFVLPGPALASPPQDTPVTPPPASAEPPQPQPQPAARPPQNGLGLTIAGFSMFGAVYLLQLAGFASAELPPPSLAPIGGPFYLAGTMGRDAPGVAVAFSLVGIVELAGLTMGITGAVRLGRHRKRERGREVWLRPAPGGLRLAF